MKVVSLECYMMFILKIVLRLCSRFDYRSQFYAFFPEEDYTSVFFAGWLPVLSHRQSLILHSTSGLATWLTLANRMWLDEMYPCLCRCFQCAIMDWFGLSFFFLPWEQHVPAGGCSLSLGIRRQCGAELNMAIWSPSKFAAHVLHEWKINLCCMPLKLWGYLLLWQKLINMPDFIFFFFFVFVFICLFVLLLEYGAYSLNIPQC